MGFNEFNLKVQHSHHMPYIVEATIFFKCMMIRVRIWYRLGDVGRLPYKYVAIDSFPHVYMLYAHQAVSGMHLEMVHCLLMARYQALRHSGIKRLLQHVKA